MACIWSGGLPPVSFSPASPCMSPGKADASATHPRRSRACWSPRWSRPSCYMQRARSLTIRNLRLPPRGTVPAEAAGGPSFLGIFALAVAFLLLVLLAVASDRANLWDWLLWLRSPFLGVRFQSLLWGVAAEDHYPDLSIQIAERSRPGVRRHHRQQGKHRLGLAGHAGDTDHRGGWLRHQAGSARLPSLTGVREGSKPPSASIPPRRAAPTSNTRNCCGASRWSAMRNSTTTSVRTSTEPYSGTCFSTTRPASRKDR